MQTIFATDIKYVSNISNNLSLLDKLFKRLDEILNITSSKYLKFRYVHILIYFNYIFACTSRIMYILKEAENQAVFGNFFDREEFNRYFFYSADFLLVLLWTTPGHFFNSFEQ